jgi:hypothetical protein
MKSRLPIAALAAVAALWLAPSPATSTRIPTRPSIDLGDVIESDPWVPDGRDPGRMVQLRYQEVSTESRSGSLSLAAAQETWTWRILRALRALYVGGLVR